MSRVADIDRYLRAHFAAERPPDAKPGETLLRPFVTLSRQAGIGGHDLGDAIVAHFNAQPEADLFGGWRVYDREICEMVGADPRYRAWLDALADEVYHSRGNDFFHQMLRSTADQKAVMKRVFLAVRTVARMGKAVLIGRGGSHVTRDMPQAINIRVVASEEERVRRDMVNHGLSEREARRLIRGRDADRARLLKAHFGADIDDPIGYHAVFNAEAMSFDEIAAWTAVMVRSRALSRALREGV